MALAAQQRQWFRAARSASHALRAGRLPLRLFGDLSHLGSCRMPCESGWQQKRAAGGGHRLEVGKGRRQQLLSARNRSAAVQRALHGSPQLHGGQLGEAMLKGEAAVAGGVSKWRRQIKSCTARSPTLGVPRRHPGEAHQPSRDRRCSLSNAFAHKRGAARLGPDCPQYDRAPRCARALRRLRRSGMPPLLTALLLLALLGLAGGQEAAPSLEALAPGDVFYSKEPATKLECVLAYNAAMQAPPLRVAGQAPRLPAAGPAAQGSAALAVEPASTTTPEGCSKLCRDTEGCSWFWHCSLPVSAWPAACTPAQRR